MIVIYYSSRFIFLSRNQRITRISVALMLLSIVELCCTCKGIITDKLAQRMRCIHSKQAGDPEKAAQAIVDVVTGAGKGKDIDRLLRLALGKDAVQRANTKIQGFKGNVDKVKHISESVVFDE